MGRGKFVKYMIAGATAGIIATGFIPNRKKPFESGLRKFKIMIQLSELIEVPFFSQLH